MQKSFNQGACGPKNCSNNFLRCPNDIPVLYEKNSYKIYDAINLTPEQREKLTVAPIKAEEIYNGLFDNYE